MLSEQERELDRQGREVRGLRERVHDSEHELSRLFELEASVEELTRLNEDLLRREEGIEELIAISKRYTVVVQSRTWRLTSPLRGLGALARKLRP